MDAYHYLVSNAVTKVNQGSSNYEREKWTDRKPEQNISDGAIFQKIVIVI